MHGCGEPLPESRVADGCHCDGEWVFVEAIGCLGVQRDGREGLWRERDMVVDGRNVVVLYRFRRSLMFRTSSNIKEWQVVIQTTMARKERKIDRNSR